MVNTSTDTDLYAAVQNALQAVLPQIRVEIHEEFRTSSGPSDAGGNPPPVIIHTWLERFNKLSFPLQKCVLVDTKTHGNNEKITAFIGSLDLCDARYGTLEPMLFHDLDTVFKDDIHQPTILAGTKAPRQPWHDLHCKIDGHAAHDVLLNFKQRWRKATKDHTFVREYDPLLHVSEEDDPDNWHVRIFRSIDYGSLKGFSKTVDVVEIMLSSLVLGLMFSSFVSWLQRFSTVDVTNSEKRRNIGPKAVFMPEASPKDIYDYDVHGLVDTIYINGEALKELQEFPLKVQGIIKGYKEVFAKGRELFLKIRSSYSIFDKEQKLLVPSITVAQLGVSNKGYPDKDERMECASPTIEDLERIDEVQLKVLSDFDDQIELFSGLLAPLPEDLKQQLCSYMSRNTRHHCYYCSEAPVIIDATLIPRFLSRKTGTNNTRDHARA
nr:phospholipase D delta [Tanacetum cinerariifolium]